MLLTAKSELLVSIVSNCKMLSTLPTILALVVAYNAAAVEALPPSQRARDTLWKAELLCSEPRMLRRCESLTKLRATTLNNLACCYRGMGQAHAALKYWKQTLGLQEGLKGSAQEFQRAGTHLNLAELYGTTRYHPGAVRHAQTAVAYLLRRFELTRPPPFAEGRKGRRGKRQGPPAAVGGMPLCSHYFTYLTCKCSDVWDQADPRQKRL